MPPAPPEPDALPPGPVATPTNQSQPAASNSPVTLTGSRTLSLSDALEAPELAEAQDEEARAHALQGFAPSVADGERTYFVVDVSYS